MPIDVEVARESHDSLMAKATGVGFPLLLIELDEQHIPKGQGIVCNGLTEYSNTLGRWYKLNRGKLLFRIVPGQRTAP